MQVLKHDKISLKVVSNVNVHFICTKQLFLEVNFHIPDNEFQDERK